MQKIVKLGVVGLGRGMIAKSLIKRDDVMVTAICDKRADRLEEGEKKIYEEIARCSKSYKCVAFSDFSDMLGADIDAVYIATDADYHVPLVVKAMEAGKHVISEIPSVNTLEEAKILRECVNAHPNLKYMLAENCCYWNFLETWRQMYRDGMLGKAVYAEGSYLHGMDWKNISPESIDKAHWRYRYPAIKYLTHSLGPILDIIDDRCVSVSCMIPDVVYNPHNTERKNGVALFRTEKGAVIRILICFDAYSGYGHRYMIVGTNGSVENDNTKPLDEAMSYASLREVDGSIYRKLEIPVKVYAEGEDEAPGRGVVKMLRDFISCIQNDTPSPIGIDAAIDMSLPGIIAYESALRGGELLEIPRI